MAEIVLKDVFFRYSSKNNFAINAVTLKVDKGDFVALLGPNGCGKTTLLRIMAGLLPVSSGLVRIDGKDPAKMKRRQFAKIIGFVTQDFAPVYNYTVAQIVLTGRLPYSRGFFSTWSKDDIDAVKNALDKVDGVKFMNSFFYNLSTGEQKRVAVARILAQNTPILLLDEPTAHLDPGHVVKIKGLLKNLNKEGKTLVAAFHDINTALELCNKLVLMKEGKILFCGTPEQVMNIENLEAVYDVQVSIIYDPKIKHPIVIY
ncbi:MAG: ABC transporter ATP-binding protein [Pseudothermotoga sp.]